MYVCMYVCMHVYMYISICACSVLPENRREWESETLEMAVASLSFTKAGRTSYLSTAEGALLTSKHAILAELGHGLSINQCADLAQFTSDMADELQKENVDPTLIKQLRDCKGSKTMLLRAKNTAVKNALCPDLTNAKTSRLSTKRAEAQDPTRNEEMFRRFTTFTSELYQAGKIPQPYWSVYLNNTPTCYKPMHSCQHEVCTEQFINRRLYTE